MGNLRPVLTVILFYHSVSVSFRIMLGSSHLYVFFHPEEEKTLKKEGKLVDVSYEMAQDEIAKNAGFKMKKKEQSNGEETNLIDIK